MKKVLLWIAAAIALLVVLTGAAVLYMAIEGVPHYPVEKIQFVAEVTPARLERGEKLVTLLCVDCHMSPLTQQLTGKRIADVPPEFGTVFSANITQSRGNGIGSWSDADIAYLLRTGVRRDGRYVPPWMAKLPHLSDEDLKSIIVFLRSADPMVAAADVEPSGETRPTLLTKVLTHVVFRKLPYPTTPIVTPDPRDRTAYGRYLVVALDCYSCHSVSFLTMNIAEPEKTPGFLGGGNALRDLQGRTVLSANITPDPTGIGSWSEADFELALRSGIRPDGRSLRFPMRAMPALSKEDTAAIYAYLRVVPAIHNVVPPP